LPRDVAALDPAIEASATGLMAAHLALAQARYRTMLNGIDTFAYAIERPITYRSRLTTQELEASVPDSAHAMARDLLAWRNDDRNTSRRVFVALVIRNPDRPCGQNGVKCFGGGRTFNGPPGSGGGFVQMEFNNLLDGKHFQSTLIHEIGHAFGLAHANQHGQDMKAGASIMGYNRAHWSLGLTESDDPGILTDEDVVTLAANRQAFPNLAAHPWPQQILQKPLVRANGEAYLHPMQDVIGPRWLGLRF
jgi:hypothetical protein